MVTHVARSLIQKKIQKKKKDISSTIRDYLTVQIYRENGVEWLGACVLE